MACEITFKNRSVQLNNRQFSNLIHFAIEVAEASARESERAFVERLKQMQNECFWPGRGMDIDDDFPDLEERKFWARMFFDTARAIFNRRVGVHDHSFWQTQAIHQAYAAGLLFQSAVRETEPRWFAETIDRREFDRVVNGIEE